VVVKVSVCVQTYNHEPFIAEALDSVLMQETDFDYEIVLGEDESQDRTREICIDCAARYPRRIRLFLRSRKDVIHIDGRQTGRFNFVGNLKAARGQYIALLDGDDYWSDRDKLQKQVDFLEAHPECSMCFHNVRVIYEDGSQEPQNYCPSGQKEISGLEDILKRNFIPSCSVMFRRGLAPELPDWFYLTQMGDWPLHLMNAEKGRIGYIDQVMGVYRVHSGGAWSSLSQIELLHENIKFYHYANAHLGFRYDRLIKTCLSDRYCTLASAYARDGDMAKARIYARRSLAERPPGRSLASPGPYLVMLRSHAPHTYQLIKKVAAKARCLPQSES
jgi:glycosyltransferase involved in cell wall biosynthesis